MACKIPFGNAKYLFMAVYLVLLWWWCYCFLSECNYGFDCVRQCWQCLLMFLDCSFSIEGFVLLYLFVFVFVTLLQRNHRSYDGSVALYLTGRSIKNNWADSPSEHWQPISKEWKNSIEDGGYLQLHSIFYCLLNLQE